MSSLLCSAACLTDLYAVGFSVYDCVLFASGATTWVPSISCSKPDVEIATKGPNQSLLPIWESKSTSMIDMNLSYFYLAWYTGSNRFTFCIHLPRHAPCAIRCHHWLEEAKHYAVFATTESLTTSKAEDLALELLWDLSNNRVQQQKHLGAAHISFLNIARLLPFISSLLFCTRSWTLLSKAIWVKLLTVACDSGSIQNISHPGPVGFFLKGDVMYVSTPARNKVNFVWNLEKGMWCTFQTQPRICQVLSGRGDVPNTHIRIFF